jgi:LuxR family maltose regulon positive regulatory protein
MAHLLRLAARRGVKLEYISTLLHSFDTATAESRADAVVAANVAVEPSILVEALTEREMDVLHHLADGLSNREIAQKLFISPNTVRTHTYNIYGKLGVHGRMQAVSRAQELGLLPTS